MDAIRFPASLRGAMEHAINGVLKAHETKTLPAFIYEEAEGELEVVILAVDQPTVLDFDLVRTPPPTLTPRTGVPCWDDEMPPPAHGVAEDDGA